MASRRQNLTISLEKSTLRQARSLAVRSHLSVSRLVAREIERLVAEDDAYQRAQRDALALLDAPFRMGGRIPVASRQEWHDRR